MITIKDLSLKGDLVLAPLAGFTDSPFRQIARSHGAALVFTELISAEGIVRRNAKTLNLARFTREERPLGIQIFGNDPRIMGEAAIIMEEMNPDLIDINLGCCAQRICTSGGGASLLRDLSGIEKIAESIVSQVKIPVSAKIRLGWDNTSRNYIETVKCLEGAGISLISVHGRTRAQKYSSNADWDAIAEITSKATVPVIGNGDICSYQQATERLHNSGCAAVMIGRASIGNPWIFSGRTPDTQELVDLIKHHLTLMCDHYGDYGVVLMRKHLVKYIHGIKNAAVLRNKLVTTREFNEIFALLNTLLIPAA